MTTNGVPHQVLSSASQSGAVEVYEQDMIEGVLDLLIASDDH